MSKKIAVINDLSGFGRCSLTAAISVLSAMGVQACPLPTAILTAQTGYPSYYCDDYTDKIDVFRREWAKMGQHFDGIYTGFVASEAQIRQIRHFIDTFDEPGTFLLVDPVLGDDGYTYDMFTPGLLEEMRSLALRADLITPNLTELCLLSGADYHELIAQEHSGRCTSEDFIDAIQKIGQEFLCREGSGQLKGIIVTGIRISPPESPAQDITPALSSDAAPATEPIPGRIGNLYITRGSSSFFSSPYIGGSYSGTGDLFASCIAGGLARGDALSDTIRMAGEFLELALMDSVKEQVPRNDGVNYEKYLSRLMSG